MLDLEDHIHDQYVNLYIMIQNFIKTYSYKTFFFFVFTWVLHKFFLAFEFKSFYPIYFENKIDYDQS